MKYNKPTITTLFVDIGGVLLTNGWDTNSRKLAAKTFHLDFDEMAAQHHLTFDTFESGKMSLDEYLYHLVFYKKRDFTPEQFKKVLFAQSKPYPQMITLITQLKAKFGLHIIAINNEPRELNDYRVKHFKLGKVIDIFLSSCYVHFRKPDLDFFRLSLDIVQKPLNQIAYIDDRLLYVDVAKTLGIQGIHHRDYQSTCDAFAALNLEV